MLISAQHIAYTTEKEYPVECLCGKVVKKKRRFVIRPPWFCATCTRIVMEVWNADDKLHNVINLSEARERILRKKRKE